jgi:hypothetical protein
VTQPPRGIIADEGQPFLEKLYADAARDEVVGEPTQVVEVAGEAVHTVHDHGVARTGKLEERRHLWALGVLVNAADSDVAEALARQRRVPRAVSG